MTDLLIILGVIVKGHGQFQYLTERPKGSSACLLQRLIVPSLLLLTGRPREIWLDSFGSPGRTFGPPASHIYYFGGFSHCGTFLHGVCTTMVQLVEGLPLKHAGPFACG